METIVSAFSGFRGVSLIQLIAMLFLALTFLEAGLDKIFNYHANRAYFQQHFENTVLKGSISMLFLMIIASEILTAALSITGAIFIFFGNASIAFMALVVASITFLALYFGQRLAKDFAGAAGLVPYLIFTLLGMYFCI